MIKKARTLVITILILVIACSMTACGTNLVTFVTEDFPTQVMNRASENINAVENLHSCGLISDETCEHIVKMINENAKNICITASSSAEEESIDNKNIEHMAKAFTWLKGKGAFVGSELNGYVYLGEKEIPINSLNNTGNKNKDNEKNPAIYFISDYLMTYYSYYTGKNGESTNKGYVAGGACDKRYFSPVEFLDDDTIETLNNLGNVPVYVLNTGIGEDLATNISEIQEVFNTGNKQAIEETLGKKFMPMTDDSGNNVYALTDSFKIAGYSRENKPFGTKSDTGYIMEVRQCGILVGKLSFKEIYLDEFEKFNELVSTDRGMYYFSKDSRTNGWRAYLMEYPVNILDSMSVSEDNTYKLKFCNSDTIKVNIKTGKIAVKDERGKWVESGDNCFIKLECNNSNSGLVINGVTYTDNLEVFDKNGRKSTQTAKVPAIYLRDYLEYSYATGYNANDLVAFGRRLRINDEIVVSGKGTESSVKDKNTSYGEKYVTTFNVNSNNERIADYIDGKGEVDRNYQAITVRDIAYIEKEDGENIVYALDSNYENNYLYREKSDEQVKSITDLKTRINWDGYKDIKIVKEFIDTGNSGSYKVDSQDAISNCEQQTYGIITRWGIFDNGTFNWLQSTELESGVNWWNNYLETNKLAYRINKEELAEYLNYNFAYELGMNGVVIYDLTTLSEIQNIYNKEQNKKSNSAIKTGFFIFGAVLLIYAIILIIFWIIDIHIALPVKLYNKATFGALDAVEEIEEDMEKDAKRYVDMGSAIRISLITAVVGIVLMSVSILKIAKIILDIIGALVDGIQKIF